MMGRAIVKETNLDQYLKDPKSGNPDVMLETYQGKKLATETDLWATPKNPGHDKPNHFWGMSIDLNSCIGCGSCVVACQVENNVPVVGKDEIKNAREMHWIRIDRYYTSDMTKERAAAEGVGKIDMYHAMENPSDNPAVVFQPMMCQHCNHAPCETVCPVAATTHSQEGLNMMAYNRCVGTRYCANNCPYKVRRFNWFKYSDNTQFDYNMNNDLGKMVLNPDVIVRSRGVMEKCTMCVQRIQYGKLEAKKAGRRPKDGEIQTACAQACPTHAITFGDYNDKESGLASQATDPRAYHVLEEYNVQPSVIYQTKVRNKDNSASKA
jgi:Fe-S-cluster-containing dehydrogenase component